MALSLDKITEQLKDLLTKRENYAQMFHECNGAISILNEQIKTVQSENIDNLKICENLIEPQDC